nr:hypothetical protein HAGR004_42000 [Bdellovibrio sp. HAGR004]BFD69188.1 hypothetical protein HAGR004_42100 [Bdellovibrio sp. HAGR004]
MSEEKSAQKSEQKIEENFPKDRVDLFPVFRTLYDLIIEFERAHAQFPKIHKYSVGKRLSTSLLMALEDVTEAIVAEDRREQALVSAIVRLEKSRILIRISHDLKAIDTKRYARFAQLIVSALAQVGGLLKVEKKRSDKVSEVVDRKNSKK